jgi:hypothetical protein
MTGENMDEYGFDVPQPPIPDLPAPPAPPVPLGVPAAPNASAPPVFPVPPPPAAPSTREATLRAELNGIRAWLLVLTVLIVILIALGATVLVSNLTGGFAVRGPDSYGPVSDTSDVAPMDGAAIKPIEDAVKAEYGEALASVEATQIELMQDTTAEYRPYAVRYRLVGSGLVVEGIVDGASDLADYGLLPTADGQTYQLTAAEFSVLRRLWQGRSNKPMGFTLNLASDNGAWTAGDKVTYGGTSYLAEELWSVSEGWSPAEARMQTDSVPTVDELVFHLDPVTKTFAYVGHQAGISSPYPSELGGG